MGAEGGVADVEDPGGEDAAEEPEEAKAAKPMRDPGQPTQAERDAHEATHLPFRIWCADCVLEGGIIQHTRRFRLTNQASLRSSWTTASFVEKRKRRL